MRRTHAGGAPNGALAKVCPQFWGCHPIRGKVLWGFLIGRVRCKANGAKLMIYSLRIDAVVMQQALEDRPISRGKFVRLNLGLSAFATLNILLLSTSLVSPEGAVQYPARSISSQIVFRAPPKMLQCQALREVGTAAFAI